MKIGINARTFAVDEPGGAVQSAMQLTSELVENTDHEVVLFGSPSLSNKFDAEISSSKYSDNQIWGIIWERTILPKLAVKEDVDILYCPNGNAPLHKFSIPVIMCIHDVNAQKGMSSGIHQLYRKTAVPLGVRNSNTIVTVSEFSKREIVNHFSISSEKVDVVYNGIDNFYLKTSGSESMGLPDKYILYVGAMNPRKNVNQLVKAYDEIRDTISHKLVLIGPENKSIHKKVDTDSFSEDIVTPGFIPQPQLKYAYENADAFVYPSLYEGFGLPPLEAMACGTPVVVSNKTSLPEVIGDSAMLVDPNDTNDIAESIYRVLNSEDVRNVLSKKGVEHAQKFTWERSRNQLLKIIKKATD
ncbi:glycosyltransferase family 4 protein [Natrinema gelatinilyticum]|uniref:glycosyltransferase family 4 protein n=1 Tax=Natrinema gelatinilyticum TaxID=2961571 RepID=UPI0020C4C41D|nr:glycosyltransferase family 1 protein [Natrinema gelatinilyticum]